LPRAFDHGNQAQVQTKPTVPSYALSDDEFEELADFLDEGGTVDIDGLLGFLNAIAVAPGLLHPSVWLPAILDKQGLAGIDHDDFKRLIDLLLRQYNDVVDALEDNSLIAPDATAVDTCRSFAEGFAIGAQLDPVWAGNADHWSFASPLAYLGEQRDLVPAHQLASFDADPDAKANIRRQLIAIVGACYETFKKYRRNAPFPTAHRPRRVGRNDPCPCGSGRKFKRCCARTPEPASSG
jgi:uncharacterized protein